MRGERPPRTPVLGPDGDVVAADRQAAPVCVVGHALRGPLVVLRGSDRLGDERVEAVGADHDPGALGDRRASPRVTADAGHDSVGGEQLVDREAVPQLGARLDGGVDQQLVEHGPARAVAARDAVDRPRGPGDRQRPEVERVGVDRRATGRLQALQQAPALERGHARRVHMMRRHRVAREGRLVDQQHPVALAREQHRRGRSRAARSDNDRVVVLAHGSQRAARTRTAHRLNHPSRPHRRGWVHPLRGGGARTRTRWPRRARRRRACRRCCSRGGRPCAR